MSLHLRLRPTRVGSESKKTRSDPDDSGATIGSGSALASGAKRTWGSERKSIAVLNITHYQFPNLVVPLRHYAHLS